MENKNNPFETGKRMGDDIRKKINDRKAGNTEGDDAAKKASTEAVIGVGDKDGVGVIVEQNENIRRKEDISIKEKELRGFLDKTMSKADFKKSRISNASVISALRILRNKALKRIKDDGEINGGEIENARALEILSVLAEEEVKSKSTRDAGVKKAIKAIWTYLKNDSESKSKSEIEGEKTGPNSELSDTEKQDVFKFFKEHIVTADMYKIGKAKGDDMEEFFKEQFIQTADSFNFLDGDTLKISSAWDLVAKELPTRIKELEDKVSVEKEKKNWTLEEVNERLKQAGAQDEDIKYFFSLYKKDRLDFLNSSDEDLAIRVGKLREKREADEAKNLNAEKLEDESYDKAREQKLKFLGDDVRNNRLLYLKKEYEINKTSAKMKRFFSNIKNLNLGNAEEEVQKFKDEYRKSIAAFGDAIVDIEGITDKEEQEIMLNYSGVSEALNLERDRLIIKKGNDPKSLQLMEEVLGGALKGYLRGYKSVTSYLSKKGAEWVEQKTDSKVLKFAGGLSGGMAFSIGLSNIFKTTGAPYWITKSILLATSTAAMTMENKENMDKELGVQEAEKVEERKLAALKEMETKIQDDLARAMKNIFAAEANTSLDYQENKDSINKKMWLKAFGKAAGKNLFFYSAGLGASELIKDFSQFLVDLKGDVFGETKVGTDSHSETPNNPEAQGKPKVMESVIYSKEELEKIAGGEPTNVHGGDLHLKSNPTGSSQKVENIYETFKRLGIKVDDSSQSAEHVTVSPEEKEKFFDATEVEVKNLKGIELDKYGRGALQMKEGFGIEVPLAKLLAENSENLTEGNMGWSPDKYSSVDDWAEKRANVIVNELKAQYPNYNFDKVSAETIVTLDMNDRADIKIAAVDDPYHLGRNENATTDLKMENDSKSPNEPKVMESVIYSKEELEKVAGGLSDTHSGDLHLKANPLGSSQKVENIYETFNRLGIEVEGSDQSVENTIVSPEEKEKFFNATEEVKFEDLKGIESDKYGRGTLLMETEKLMEEKGIELDKYGRGALQMETDNLVAEKEKIDLSQSASVEARQMTVNEMSIAYSAGVSASEYARINDLSVEEFLADTSESNAKLREVVQTLNDKNIIEGPWITLSGALRNVGEDEFTTIFGDKKLDGFRYEEYLADILKKELTEIMQLNSEQRLVFEELLKIKKESISGLDSKIFQSFMEVTREKLGVVEVENNTTVGNYVIKTIRKAYEMGEMDNFRLALSRIKL